MNTPNEITAKPTTTENESYWDAVEREEREYWEKRRATKAGKKEENYHQREVVNGPLSPWR